jgi:hypothetical protein
MVRHVTVDERTWQYKNSGRPGRRTRQIRTVASLADLSLPDPNVAFFCYDPDCLQGHSFQWKDGVMTDLGALPVNNNSAAGSINSRASITGQSQTSTIDPGFGISEFRRVLWKDGKMIDLAPSRVALKALGSKRLPVVFSSCYSDWRYCSSCPNLQK